MRTYPHGVPCWIDTEQPEPHDAARFYGELLGWTFEDSARGSYLVASLDGQDVAAIAPGSDATTVAWNTYIAVDDADVTAAAVAGAGGSVLQDPADAGPGGRMAICSDPGGARPALAGAGPSGRAARQRARSVELQRPADRGSSRRARVLRAAVRMGDRRPRIRRDDPPPGYGDHLEATIDPDIRRRQREHHAPPGFEDAIGWLGPAGAREGEHWHITFTVEDRDTSVAAAERLGATVISAADTDWTKDALIRDPQGAELTISQFVPPGS